ncbi:MAG: preprotein translocase subunit SecA, partial [Planctomycetota bacterium]
MSVIIVDEDTGRKMVGRQWSDGLHQAVEAKEGVEIKDETQTLATITLQNFFKLYKALAGMTGTAQTEAEEFDKIYKLDVVSIPTNRPVIRQDHTDLVYRTLPEKLEALLDDIKITSDAGRPVLVGTASVESSELLSQLLTKKYGIQHEVLNAKQHEREGHIVAHAGEQHKDKHGRVVGNVTIATNMAGRGTDIKPAQKTFFTVEAIDGDKVTLKQRGTDETMVIGPDDAARGAFDLESVQVGDDVGGLHVIGSERHTARRIDDQLRGRSGRQGDAGSSRFYVSLADPLMKMFMPEWAVNILKKAGLQPGEPIESRLVTKQIAGAQKKVEERNFLSRKSLLEYDEVMDVQRLQFYGLRQKVLEGRDIDRVIWDMIGESIEDAVDRYVASDFRASVLAEYGKETFGNQLDVEDLRGLKTFDDVDDLLKQKAKNEVGDTIRSTLGEYMGEDRLDSSVWDTASIASFAQNSYGVTLTHKQIKETGAEELAETIIEAAYNKVDATDTSGMKPYLEPLYPLEELCKWANGKFSIGLEPAELIQDETRNISKSPTEINQMIEERGRAAYLKRETEYPVDHTLGIVSGGADVIDREDAARYLGAWAKLKYAM